MPRIFYAVTLAALVAAMPAVAQKNMKATAPEKMMPPGASDAMSECDKLAMDQHVKMENRARFVKNCVAEKMGRKTQ
jgi:hypothetical protein